jgi:outer membrane protein assembly factor BamB
MRNSNFFLITVISIFFFSCTKQADQVSQWRGDNRSGVFYESGLLEQWPDEGPEMLWAFEGIGEGYGSVVEYKNVVYVNGESDSLSQLFAFNINGELLWKAPNGPEYYGEGFAAGFPGTRSTPTIYNNMAYVSSTLGRIACIDIKTGKEIWNRHMVDDFEGRMGYFGYGESLLVDSEKVYCMPGGEKNNMIALDRFTGETLWVSKGVADIAGYSAPVMINMTERDLVLTMSKEVLMAFDAMNGELLWHIKEDSVTQDGKYCNPPIFDNGILYCIAGIEKGSGAYALKLANDGSGFTKIWENPEVKNEIGGFVKVEDKLYVTGKDNRLRSLNAQTGVVLDSIRGLRGSIVMADNMLYVYNDNGRVNLINKNDNNLEIAGRFRIEKGTKEHFAHPAIFNGTLYIRHGNALMAYKIK